MDSHQLKSQLASLYTWSKLEKNRVLPPHADPRQIASFQTIENLIQHSLKPANLIQKQTLTGVPLQTPKAIKRTLLDEELMEKLLKKRHQIPLSSRILRPESSS